PLEAQMAYSPSSRIGDVACAGRLRFLFACFFMLLPLIFIPPRLLELPSSSPRVSSAPGDPRRLPPNRLASRSPPGDAEAPVRRHSAGTAPLRAHSVGGDAAGSGAPPPARLLGRRRRRSSSRGEGPLPPCPPPSLNLQRVVCPVAPGRTVR
uniref:Uncharacterized protein n=1 Tax=Aegilops tauschii subsp. strangulata TaxID=200361 RepID=A0A452ZYZ3_AEGTS